MRRVLIVAEVALAFVLLVASGLLMRSFFKLLDVDPGFVATNVLTAGLPIEQEQHPDPVELNTYLASIRAVIKAVPGVRETALASALPLEGWGFGTRYSVAGREPTDPVSRPLAFFKVVSPSYVDALGIKLRAGRILTDDDRVGAAPVALINETLAKRELPARIRSLSGSWCGKLSPAGPNWAGKSRGRSSASSRTRRSPGSATRPAPACTSRTCRAHACPSVLSCKLACAGITAERHSDGG